MTTVLLFHHALGQTTGFLAFTEELREAGHTVHAPDLYDGKTFADIDEGVANAKQVGFGEIIRRGSAAAEVLPADLVYAGFSLGGLSAQSLAQTRPVREGRSSTTPPCRPPSSTARGPRACRSRST
jgi:esterase/lipase